MGWLEDLLGVKPKPSAPAPTPSMDPCFDWKKKVSAIATEKAEMSRVFELERGSYEKRIADFEHKLGQAEIDSDSASFWNNKYPKASIEYACRGVPGDNNTLKLDVRLLVQPNDFHIHSELALNKLFVENGNFDETAMKIYKWAYSKKYKYAFDHNVYGASFPEFWEFPFEINERIRLKEFKGVDCDSWAVWLASYLIAAGIPSWRVRVVIGQCNLGGHATLYVYSDESQSFHHMNSTYGLRFTKASKLSDLPITDDARNKTDDFGIWGVWFSFNNQHSWSKFISPDDEKAFKLQLNKKVVITPQ